VRWGLVTVTVAAVCAAGLLACAIWYVVAIVLPQEASRKNQAQVDAMYAKVWAAYCHGEPYPTEGIRTFCTNQSLMSSP
jgi:hypothetical protein